MFRARRGRFAAVAVTVAGLAGAADRNSATTSKIPILTVCEALSDAGLYAGQEVIVVGRSIDTSEGSWLDENCGLNLSIGGRSYPTAISTAYAVSDFAPPPRNPKGFKWDKRLLQRSLDEVKKTTRIEYDAHWCAVFGRLETALPWKEAFSDGRSLIRDGYGHMNATRAQLVAAGDGFLKMR